MLRSRHSQYYPVIVVETHSQGIILRAEATPVNCRVHLRDIYSNMQMLASSVNISAFRDTSIRGVTTSILSTVTRKIHTYTFSRTMPLAWEAPPKGLAFHLVPMWAFLNSLSAHRCSRRWFTCFRAVRIPRGLPEILTLPVNTYVYDARHRNRYTIILTR